MYNLSLFVLAFLTGLSLGKEDTSFFPPWKDATRIGCSIDTRGAEGPEFVYTYVWVDYTSTPRWEKLYSIRDAKKMLDSMKDCHTWMKDYRAYVQKQK